MRNRAGRIAIAIVVLIGLWLVAREYREFLTVDGLQALVANAGFTGMLAFLALFSFGSLIQLPGVIFLVVARIAYGPVTGFFIAYVGALASISVSFVVIRAVGGKALASIEWPPAKRVLTRLLDRPIRTVAFLRTVMLLSPPLNMALALSSVRYRDYLAGSAIGLVAPVAVWVLAADLLATMGVVL